MKIIQKIAQGQDRSVIIGREVRKGLFPELGGDAGPGGGAIGLANLPVAGELILREHLQGGIPGSGIIEDDLRRGKPGHLIEQVDTGVGAGKGRGMGLAGGDITGGKAGLILPSQAAAQKLLRPASREVSSRTVPGVTTRIMSRFTRPLAVAGSSVCSQMATL